MERRKILLGSGAALATVLAGCSSDETSDDDGSDDDGSTDTDTNTDTDDNGDDGDDEREIDDVPGLDGSKLTIDDDAVTIEKIEHKDDTVDVVATTEVTDLEKLFPKFKALADDFDEAAADLDAFVDAVSTVEWVLEHDDNHVVSFYVDVEWITSYLDGKITDDQFMQKIKNTAE